MNVRCVSRGPKGPTRLKSRLTLNDLLSNSLNNKGKKSEDMHIMNETVSNSLRGRRKTSVVSYHHSSLQSGEHKGLWV